MPIYEYRCQRCGATFEYTQPITAPALEYCPEEVCQQEPKGSGRVKRLLSRNVAFIFNGSGFYITDYARKSGSESSAERSESSSTATNSSTACACGGACEDA